MVEVIVSGPAVADFEGLPEPVRPQVLNAIDRLATWPEVSGVKALRGEPAYRIRTGDYRIVFEVREGVPWVLRIGKRDGVYDRPGQHRQQREGRRVAR